MEMKPGDPWCSLVAAVEVLTAQVQHFVDSHRVTLTSPVVLTAAELNVIQSMGSDRGVEGLAEPSQALMDISEPGSQSHHSHAGLLLYVLVFMSGAEIL